MDAGSDEANEEIESLRISCQHFGLVIQNIKNTFTQNVVGDCNLVAHQILQYPETVLGYFGAVGGKTQNYSFHYVVPKQKLQVLLVIGVAEVYQHPLDI